MSVRTIRLLSITDGFMYDFADDGLDGGGKPRVRRNHLLRTLKKKIKGVGPVFVAGKRVEGADGSLSFEPLAPESFNMDARDNLAESLESLDEKTLAFLKKNVLERAKNAVEAVKRDTEAVQRHLEKALAAAKAVSASASMAPMATAALPKQTAAKGKEKADG